MGLFDPVADLFGIGNDGGAENTQRQALAELDKIQTPDPEELKIKLQKLVQQGIITPEQAKTYLVQKSEMSGVTSDPQALAAARSALAGLQDVYQQGGLTDIDRARLGEIQDTEAQAERGSREAIIQNAAERGVSGSGLELAAQLANQQGSATRKAKADLDVNAQAQERSLKALSQAGTLGADLEGQLFNEGSQKALAQDAINKFNATNQNQAEQFNVTNRNAAQEKNLGEKQRIADTNVALTNEQEIQNKQVPQTVFENKMKKATAALGQSNNIAQTELDKQRRKDAFTGNLLGSAATVGASAFGAPRKVGAFAEGGRIPGEAPFEGDDPENDLILALLSPGETVVPRSIADDPQAAAAFAANPPPAEKPSSINPVVVEALKKKFAAAQGGGTDKGRPAPAPAPAEPPVAGASQSYSPEERRKLEESLRSPSAGQVAAMAAAGLGDAIAASAGAPGKGMEGVQGAIDTARDRSLKAFDKGREDIEYQRKISQQAEMDDVNSAVSKAYQALAAKYTGKKPEDFASLNATRIAEVLPVVEKSYQADQAAQARRDNARLIAGMREHSIGEKEDQWREGQWQKLTDKVNALNAGSRRALGVAATNNMRADRLLETAANPNATSQDIANIVSDIQAVYKGGVPDQVSLAHGDYKTFNRKLSEIMTFVTNNPQGANSPGVVARLKEIALELKKVDNKVISDNLGINEVAFRKIISTDPQRWAELQASVMATTDNPGGADAEAVAWAKANPNDPRAKKILELNGAR